MADYARVLFGISIRQACAWFNISRMMFYYERKSADDSDVIDKLTELADRYPRYGFHKLFIIIRREDHVWNHKRVYRVYCEMKLNMRRKFKKWRDCKSNCVNISNSYNADRSIYEEERKA